MLLNLCNALVVFHILILLRVSTHFFAIYLKSFYLRISIFYSNNEAQTLTSVFHHHPRIKQWIQMNAFYDYCVTIVDLVLNKQL